MGQQSTTNTLQKKHRPRHWMRRSILLVLLVYLCVATLPYARQTASADLPEDWRSSALSSPNVDSAAILETGGNALDIRLRLIASAQKCKIDTKRPPTFSVDGLCDGMGFSDFAADMVCASRLFPLQSALG